MHFSAEDKASGVKFLLAVHRHPGQSGLLPIRLASTFRYAPIWQLHDWLVVSVAVPYCGWMDVGHAAVSDFIVTALYSVEYSCSAILWLDGCRSCCSLALHCERLVQC